MKRPEISLANAQCKMEREKKKEKMKIISK